MKLTVKATAIVGFIFAALCFAAVIHEYFTLGDVTDPQQLDDAKNYMIFWALLGVIGIASGAGSWWLISKQSEDDAQ